MIAPTPDELSVMLASAWLPFVRVSGAMIAAPLFSAAYIPTPARILVSIFITAIILPMLPPVQATNLIGIEAMLLAVNELLIGICIGLIVQLVFDAIILAGQIIAMGMGLGFAMMVDPQRGAQVPVLSQFLLIFTMLIFVALNGHIDFLALLARSFEYWPVAGDGISVGQFSIVWMRGAELFSGAIRVSIPAVVALLVVQLAIGIVSRAAPTLNLFAVGFPIAMLIGFLVVDRLLPNLLPLLTTMLGSAFIAVELFLGG
ncbi:flagellar biosynthetic protein FliR [Zhongshania arctica]|uniref:Flagellar biosynthetic protein FliR n=1 Tax=Zhongshania arctica TaxID=3238302 RepID=A0ABV3TUW3_9GAMM|tara:strand:+ start:1294 stop:2070 length:777 start_codon:yes stop_codon:yes gene_type:complete